jgi:hypothetical protein
VDLEPGERAGEVDLIEGVDIACGDLRLPASPSHEFSDRMRSEYTDPLRG